MAWLYIIAFNSITVKLVAIEVGLVWVEVILDRKNYSKKRSMFIRLHFPVIRSGSIRAIETKV